MKVLSLNQFIFKNGSGMNTGVKPKKGVESLLGEHSNLVNLDNLVKVISSQVLEYIWLSRFTNLDILEVWLFR